MKYLFSVIVLSVALINIGCPNNNNSGQPAAVVGTPTTQCLSNGYPQTFPYGYGRSGNSCAYGFSNNPYYFTSWRNGNCPLNTIPVYNPVYNRLNGWGVSCLPVGALGTYNYLAYGYYSGGWSQMGYFPYSSWDPYHAVVSCTVSIPGVCNCVPVGNPYFGQHICARP